MLKQLVTLLVLLSVLNLGRLQQNDIESVYVLVELTPFLKEINNTVRQLSAQLEEHRVQLQEINKNIESLPSCTCGDSTPAPPSIFPTLTPPPPSPPGDSQLYTCGGTGGWRRTVYLNMTNPSSTCPSGWQLTDYSKRTCGRVSDDASDDTFDSTTFTVSGGEYSSVCGRIKAYQWGRVEGFVNYHVGEAMTIDSVYAEGVSLTHGNPRQHIWSFVAGYTESDSSSTHVCPCDSDIDISVPDFVGQDYFCESGANEEHSSSGIFYPDDPLWDGMGCGLGSRCCSFNPRPPYFVKQLPSPTSDDLEARILLDYYLSDEDIAIELVELYVK